MMPSCKTSYNFLLFHTVQQSRDGHSESRRTPYAEQCRLFKINWKKINKKLIDLKEMLIKCIELNRVK